jgi:hypothetical protein
MRKFVVLLPLFFFLISTSGFCQGLSFSAEHKNPIEPAFEKVYVQIDQLVSTPNGTYYIDDNDQMTKVKSVLGDEDGLYVILIRYQCPLCGKTYSEKEPDAEYDCPIFKRKINSKIWLDR